MTIAIIDHIFVVLLFVVYPIYSSVWSRNQLRKIAAGEVADRIALYRETLLIEWLACGTLILTWHLLERPFEDLGMVQPGGYEFFVGIGLVLVLLGFLAHALRSVRRMSAARREKNVAALGDLVNWLPHNRREYRYFAFVSVTAGIVEELVYRGFVIWYLSLFMPLAAAIVASSVLFGLGHAYQGVGGVVRTGLAGLILGVYYVFTGSIWLPMLAHALADVIQGKAIMELLDKRYHRV